MTLCKVCKGSQMYTCLALLCARRLTPPLSLDDLPVSSDWHGQYISKVKSFICRSTFKRTEVDPKCFPVEAGEIIKGKGMLVKSLWITQRNTKIIISDNKIKWNDIIWHILHYITTPGVTLLEINVNFVPQKICRSSQGSIVINSDY